MDIQTGDRLTLKKAHPCGSFEWEVLRVGSREWEVLRSGADFRLKCAGCGHQIMSPRSQIEKKIRKISRTNS